MASAPTSGPTRSSEREWWLGLLLVLRRPAAFFVALRDDSESAAAARQEPVLATILLAGVGAVLMTSAVGGLLDDAAYDGLVVAVYLFIAGLVYGVAGYFGLGGLLYLGASLAGSLRSYRTARHIVAFAAVPVALTVLVWPVRLALYGGDLFRRGGSDTGAGNAVFEALELVAIAWAVALLVVGARSVYGWSWPRAAAAAAFPAAVPALALAAAAGLVG